MLLKENKRAFTLVEILIGSLVVLFIAGVGGAGVIFNQSLIQKERYRVIALEYASANLEQLLFDTEFDDENLDIDTHSITALPDSDIFWTRNAPAVSYTVSWYPISGVDIDPNDPDTLNAKLISLTISWSYQSGANLETSTETLYAIKLQ